MAGSMFQTVAKALTVCREPGGRGGGKEYHCFWNLTEGP
jgi:hypothetical protein